MAAIGTNTITDLVRSVYLPGLRMSMNEHRLAYELRYGMLNPMPKFDWWPWMNRPPMMLAESRRRMAGAWQIIRYGDNDTDEWG